MDRISVGSTKMSSRVRRNKWKKQCSICGHRFNRLNRHLNSAHSGGRHRCKICPCAFHQRSGLEHHIRHKHAGGKWNGSLPRKSVTRPASISNHSKVSASKLCKKAAISRLNYKAIPSSFATKSNKPTHTKLGSIKSNNSSSYLIRVVCEECGNTMFKRHLEKHLQSLHRGGSFACDLCPCSAFNVSALTNHKRRHYANESPTIPTYLTRLKQQENENAGHRIASFSRWSSVEILDDQVQQAPTSRESSCSPEIPTTFCFEGSSLDSNQVVLIEPDLSDKSPKKSLNMETLTGFKKLPTAAVLPINQPAVITASQLVERQGAHQQPFTSSSATKKQEQPTYIPMRVALSSKTSLPLQAAIGNKRIDFHIKEKRNVTYFAGQDSGVVSEEEPRCESILGDDFNPPEESLWDIRPSTGMQVPLQPSFPTCHVCNTMFVSPAALAQHMKIHVTVCGYCGKTVPTMDIVAHMPNCASAVGMSNSSSSHQ